MRDATEEYKTSLKNVNPNFDAEYFDRLILEADEPQNPTLEDPIGFDQLDPIGTNGTPVGPSALGEEAVASTSQTAEELIEPPTDQPTAPSTAQPAGFPTAQPVGPLASQEAA